MATLVEKRTVDRVWLKSYPPGVPAEADVDRYSSVPQLLGESCRKFASQPAFTCMDATLDFATLDRLSRDFAAWLVGGAGLAKGDRVAVMMPNVLQYPVALFGILRAGMVVVNCNPLYTPRELEHQLNDSGATAIVILENFAKTLEEVIDRTPVQHVVMASMGDLLGFLFGTWITFAVRHLAKTVPAYKLPLTNGRKVTPFNRATAEGMSMPLTPSPQTLDSIA